MVRMRFFGSAGGLLLILAADVSSGAAARASSQSVAVLQPLPAFPSKIFASETPAPKPANRERLAQFKIVEPPSASSPDTIRLKPPPSEPSEGPRRRPAAEDQPAPQSDSDAGQTPSRSRYSAERSERRKWRERRRRHHYASPPAQQTPPVAAPAQTAAPIPAPVLPATPPQAAAPVATPAAPATPAATPAASAQKTAPAVSAIPVATPAAPAQTVATPSATIPTALPPVSAASVSALAVGAGASAPVQAAPVVIREIIREYIPVVVVLPCAVWTAQDFAMQPQIPLPPFVEEAYRRQQSGLLIAPAPAVNGTIQGGTIRGEALPPSAPAATSPESKKLDSPLQDAQPMRGEGLDIKKPDLEPEQPAEKPEREEDSHRGK